MTDQPVNGSGAADPMAVAKKRFAQAYALAVAPGGQLQFNPMQLLIELELLKINLGVLIGQACASGMDQAEFNTAVVDMLTAQAEMLEKPQFAIAPAGALRKR